MDRKTKVKLKFINWFFNLFPDKYCWADCVSWAYSNRINPFKISSSLPCKIESKEHEHNLCYCGGWTNGKCYHTLPKIEKDRIQAEIDAQPDHPLPF